MQNSDIISKDAQVDTLLQISKQQEGMIESLITTLTSIKDSKKINESNFRSITNVYRELDSLRELFFLRLLNSLKRGDMIIR
jgi:hypothetical protein